MPKHINPIITIIILVVAGLSGCVTLPTSLSAEQTSSEPATTALPLEPERHQVWFAPNLGSIDMLHLFTNPEQWVSAREKIDVFKFYGWTLNTFTDDSQAGLNILPNFVHVQAFSKLKEWGIDIAVEGPVKHRGKFEFVDGKEVLVKCMGRDEWVQGLIHQNKEVISSAHSNGAEVRYMALDEPFFKAYPFNLDGKRRPCSHNSTDEIADDVVEFIKQVQSAYPSVLIGDIEPYPSLSVNQLKEWIIALEERGVSLPFFHLDFSEGRVAQFRRIGWEIDPAADLQELKSFLEDRNIAFGVIYSDGAWDNLHEGYTDEAYFNNTIDFIREVQLAIGEPDHSIFQSWIEYPRKPLTRKMPINLPENDTDIYSHTRLINEGLGILREK